MSTLVSMSLYTWLFRTLIHRTDPEWAHHVAVRAIALAGECAPTRALMRATIGYVPPSPTSAQGRGRRPVYLGERRVPGRLGLAAGMDKDAQAIAGMTALGFGFVEIGTVTPRPQPGNDRPRLWRILDQHAIRNRMGFNNAGAQAAARTLKKLRSTHAGRLAVVGANIGKNKVTPEDQAPKDYRICARELAPWVDFVVVNVSSPNTPGLRALQSVDHLRPILQAARAGCEDAVSRRVPLFVKIAPDLAEEDIIQIVALTIELGLEGIVATNTTIDHEWGEGGVSGAPLFSRALKVVELVARHMDDDQVLIATGGISTAEDARRMMAAGADLVEAFSAFIYQGPTWPGHVNRQLAAD